MILKKNNNQSLFRVLAGLWTIILTVLLLLPGSDMPDLHLSWLKYADKVIHFLSFFFLTFIYLLSTLNEDSKVRYRLFFLLLVYAVVMESIQHTVQQSREFELADMISNISGIVSAYCICHLIRCFK